jgi:hypothetical protein
MIDPSTGLPYSDDELEAFEGIEYVRTAHYPDPPDVQSQLKLQAESQQGIPPEFRPLRGLHVARRGSSVLLNVGESKTVFEVRSRGEDAELIAVAIGAQPVGVSFKPTILPPFGPDSFGPINSAILVGKLTWGIGQMNYEAFFDIYRGTIIAVPANYIRFDASWPDLGVGNQPTFQVGASVAYGTTPSFKSAPARFTQFLGVLSKNGDPGDTVSVQTPPWAIAFTLATGLPTTDLDIEVLDSGLALAGMHYRYNNVTNNAGHQENQFPIWNGAELIRVHNNAATSVAVNVIYTLAF